MKTIELHLAPYEGYGKTPISHWTLQVGDETQIEDLLQMCGGSSLALYEFDRPPFLGRVIGKYETAGPLVEGASYHIGVRKVNHEKKVKALLDKK